jgi:hypothetical protein
MANSAIVRGNGHAWAQRYPVVGDSRRQRRSESADVTLTSGGADNSPTSSGLLAAGRWFESGEINGLKKRAF